VGWVPVVFGRFATCTTGLFLSSLRLGFANLTATMIGSPVNACRRHARNEPVVKRGPTSENHRIDETKHPDSGGALDGREKGHDDCAQSWRRLLASLQDAVKVKRGGGLGSGGFRSLRDLHHRLVSLEPPARGKRGAMLPVLAP
jgi:hypothetical protein